MTGLLETAFAFNEIVTDDKMPLPDVCDRYVSLTALPAIFGTFLDGNLPPAPATFALDPNTVAYWEKELEAVSGYRVGVVWRGGKDNAMKPVRDVPANFYKKLSKVHDVQLITLQQAPRKDDVKKLGNKRLVTDLTERLDDSNWSLKDTAAVIQNLDLVVTCDTMVGHLAGSLGKDT